MRKKSKKVRIKGALRKVKGRGSQVQVKSYMRKR